MLRCYEQVVRQAPRVDADSAVPVSFFEMTVAMAYLAFAHHGVERTLRDRAPVPPRHRSSGEVP